MESKNQWVIEYQKWTKNQAQNLISELTNVQVVKLELAEYIMTDIKTLIKITAGYTESVDIPSAFALIFRSAGVQPLYMCC